ncbi:MAG: hypothetical protein M3R70_11115 [Actinomycetota bacterium]|nr:hypothetical protein [Actinomycetota bacterium]
MDNGAATDTVFVDHTNPIDGQTITAPNSGNGPQSVWWQFSRLAGTTPHVATIWITSAAILTDCRFTVQALVG